MRRDHYNEDHLVELIFKQHSIEMMKMAKMLDRRKKQLDDLMEVDDSDFRFENKYRNKVLKENLKSEIKDLEKEVNKYLN